MKVTKEEYEFAKTVAAKVIKISEQKQNEDNIVIAGGNIPKPFTGEFISFLLVNALRNLDKEQFHNLALSLAVRDEKFTIKEYESQCEI